MRTNEKNLTRHELLVLFEGKTMLEIAPLITSQHTAMIGRGWKTKQAQNLLSFAVNTTNRKH